VKNLLIRESDKQKTGKPIAIVLPHILRRKRNAIQMMIAQRAYELFERRGRLPGHQMEDWAQAESELLYPCCINLKESSEAIVLRADLPGSFTPEQLRVSIEPRQVMIDGEREISVICGHADKTRTTHTETRIQRIFRVYELPTDADASRATAALLGSTAEIRLPKIFTASASASSMSSVAFR
jgi:HSP20 family molecular chaperone IbpA